MMNLTKIRLSPVEMELVERTDWILTKNAILKKIRSLLEIIQEQQQDILQLFLQHFPEEVGQSSPKISKGENYQGLPYLILDHPRLFNQANIFAIRTLFWWGHYFSSTLHLSGAYKKKYSAKIIAAYKLLSKKGFYCCVNDNPWEHHFETSNYIRVNEMSRSLFENKIEGHSFIKLAKQIPLQPWDAIAGILIDDFRETIQLLID